jgi:hypothetical protein
MGRSTFHLDTLAGCFARNSPGPDRSSNQAHTGALRLVLAELSKHTDDSFLVLVNSRGAKKKRKLRVQWSNLES